MTLHFEVSSFEQVQATPGTVLLRIGGAWLGPVRERLAPPMLVIDDGRRTHRVAALPGPDDANPLAGPEPTQWRAAYAAPEALLGGRPAFALDIGRGGLIDIPRPGVRTIVRPAAAPAAPVDDRAAREEQERARAEQELREQQERLRADQEARDQAKARRAAEADRDAEIARTAALREEALRRAQEEREAELRRAQAVLAADAARAQASRDAAARRIGELETRIDGYRDMLAQATEALALANGRLEADAHELAGALDVAASQTAQREQAEADALAFREQLAELEAEHAQALQRATSAESELARAQDHATEQRTGPDPAELAELQASIAHERAVAERLRDAYGQESAARNAEVLAWHAECQQAVDRAEQLAEALAAARQELERLRDPADLGVGSGSGLIRFASKD